MDTTEWLRGLGLEQYGPAFREHDIDGEVLRRLTADDLRELGVASIGHRRRLLDAIAALAARTADPEIAPAERDGIDDRQLVPVVERPPSSRQREPPAGSGLFQETERPFLGRDDELQLLLRRWQEAKAGDGRAVLISGEPGIGKSRLAAELAARIASEPHTRLRYFCTPYYQDTPLHPIVSQMEAAAYFARGDTAEQKLEKLRLLLAPSSPDADEIALVADLLSLPNTAADLDRSPQRKRERLLETLLRQIEALARLQPVLALVEDADWSDPTTRELLDLVVERMPSLPLLLLVTSAKDLGSSWHRRPHVTSLALSRLNSDDSGIVIHKQTGEGVIADEVIAKIIGRSEGVPLLLEELLAAGLEGIGPDAAVAAIPAVGVDTVVPAILQGLLAIRLDRLGSAAREAAQLAAVLGPNFTHEMIAQVARRPDIDPALGQLVDAGLLHRRGEPPQSVYRFKHSLLRDTVYAALPRPRREELHAWVAAGLEQRFPEVAGRHPELVARHLSVAGATGRAIEYWFRAGERKKRRAADHEAIACYRAAQRLAEELPDPFERAAWELRISIALGPVLMKTTSSAAPEVARVYARARRLAEESGRSVRLFQALWASWLASFSAGDLRTTGGLVDQLFALAREQRSPEFMLQAHHAAWTAAAFLQGDMRAAQRSLESGMPFYRPEISEHHALLYGGHDPGVCGHSIGAMVLALLGQPDRALAEAKQGLSLGRRLAHYGSLAHAYQFVSEAYYLRRDAGALSEIATEMLPFAIDHGSALAVANAKMFQGWALIAAGRTEDGLANLRDGLASWRRTGSKLHGPFRLSRVADGMLLAGETAAALELLEEAAALARQTGEYWSDAEIDRLTGIARVRRSGSTDDLEQAEYGFRRAIAAARERGARLFELRAATSLAQHLAEQGRGAEGDELLGRIYSWFTEGFDTADLKEARALLAELT